MAQVFVHESTLQVSLSPLEKIRALQPSLELPLSSVRGATDDPAYLRDGLGLRAPGTGLPGVIAEGTFHKDGYKTLVLWKRGQETVVIELKNAKWDRLVIGCANADALANQINRALHS